MNSTSLVDAFPFSTTVGITDNDKKKTYGIFDCIDTDGTFIITNLLSYLKQQQQQQQQQQTKVPKILWIGCGPFTSQSQNIIQALKKSNCDFGRTLPSSLWIHCIPTDLATHVFSPTKNDSDEMKDDDDWDSNEYLRKLIQTIQLQITKMTTSGNEEEVVMVLDDVTALSMLVGNTNAFYFLQKLRSMNHTIIFKCSHELESQKDLPLVHNKPIQRQQMPWIAAGGGSSSSGGRYDSSHYWESTLVDLADEIIDVLPLPSGFSKQVHGRIIFTSRSSTNISSTMVNFYLSETQGVKIMRLRSKQN